MRSHPEHTENLNYTKQEHHYNPSFRVHNEFSIFLKNILQNIMNRNYYYIKGYFNFKNKMKNFLIPNNYLLASLDVISLSIMKNGIESKNTPMHSLAIFLCNTTSIIFNIVNKNTYSIQIEGCIMGVSISSVMTQIVMKDLEEAVINKIDFRLPFF